MPRFRVQMPSDFSGSVTDSRARALIAEMLRPAHFFLGSELVLEWEHVAEEELVWEIFQSRLLDQAQTRQRRSLAAWKIYATSTPGESRPSEPILALYLDAETRQLHVVRGLDSYVWEGYDAGGNVYLSREKRKWVRELVATLHLDRFADVEELRDELTCSLFQAVVGTSRLPLSSIEAPLPAFSFGQLFYCHRPDAPEASGPVRGWDGLLSEMLRPGLNPREEAHLLETFLHAAPIGARSVSEAPIGARSVSEAPIGARSVSEGQQSEDLSLTLRALMGAAADLPDLLRRMFNEVSLSPYTDLVAQTLAFLRSLETLRIFSTEQVVDFLSYLLRHIGRHLTAFDLVLFHHRGANYPDALLLDAVLQEYLTILDRRPDLFVDSANRIRRRALRQGWLLRRRYEGHAVPNLPTSPGENMRVLPPSHPRVPEEQITQPARRKRRLYADDPLLPRLEGPAAEVLRQSFFDLEHSEEWRELGLGVFLDRPIGVGKAAAEPDATLLLSAEAFSISIARQRLLALAGDVGVKPEDALIQRLLARPSLHGLPLDAIGGAVRPGVVSLADARRAASDFVFLRSTRSSVKAFLSQFDFTPLTQQFPCKDLFAGGDVLIARSAASGGLVIYDARLRPRIELEVAAEAGFENRAGQEYPVRGLRVLSVSVPQIDGDKLQTHEMRKHPLSLPPCR